MARAIDPIHQYGDGDVVFALATRSRAFPASDGINETRLANVRFRQLSAIIAAAADTVARAVVHAMLHATSAGPMTSYCDQFPSAGGSPAFESRLRSSSSTVHKEHEGR